MAEPGVRKGERGVALLVAVVATALLTMTVMEFTYSSQVGYRRAAHWLEAERARLAAESGIALAAEVLSFDGELAELVKGATIPPEVAPLLKGVDPRLAGVDGALDLWARCSEPGPWSCSQTVGAECTLPLSAPSADAAAAGETRAGDSVRASGPDGSFTVRIEDETGFYNLNRLSWRHPTDDELERVTRLFRLVDADPALVGPITDWVDTDPNPLAFPPGAESSQYSAAGRLTPPRNAPLATFRELALVLGMKSDALRKLRKVTTVLGSKQQKIEQINVNTAPLAVLQSLSMEFDDESLLAAVHAQRCVRPFLDYEDLIARVPEVGRARLRPLLSYSSSWFRVRSTAHVGDTVQSAEALLYRQGARIEPKYILVQRGANIDDVDSPPAAGFEVPTTPAGGRS